MNIGARSSRPYGLWTDPVIRGLYAADKSGCHASLERVQLDAVHHRVLPIGGSAPGPDGVFLQWVPLHSMAITDYRSIIRTFQEARNQVFHAMARHQNGVAKDLVSTASSRTTAHRLTNRANCAILTMNLGVVGARWLPRSSKPVAGRAERAAVGSTPIHSRQHRSRATGVQRTPPVALVFLPASLWGRGEGVGAALLALVQFGHLLSQLGDACTRVSLARKMG